MITLGRFRNATFIAETDPFRKYFAPLASFVVFKNYYSDMD